MIIITIDYKSKIIKALAIKLPIDICWSGKGGGVLGGLLFSTPTHI